MVIWSEFRTEQYRVNDHPYHASQFIIPIFQFERFHTRNSVFYIVTKIYINSHIKISVMKIAALWLSTLGVSQCPNWAKMTHYRTSMMSLIRSNRFFLLFLDHHEVFAPSTLILKTEDRHQVHTSLIQLFEGLLDYLDRNHWKWFLFSVQLEGLCIGGPRLEFINFHKMSCVNVARIG